MKEAHKRLWDELSDTEKQQRASRFIATVDDFKVIRFDAEAREQAAYDANNKSKIPNS